MRQSIILRIPRDLAEMESRQIDIVFQGMYGWLESKEGLFWYGRETDPQYICASADPRGYSFEGELESALWTGWLTVLCARLTLALGAEVHDAGM